MSRTSRLFELLELLQSSGTRNAAELTDRLGVDERTVRRDIEALQELGVPIESRRGRYGGYRVGAGYRMPPLMLDDAEALGVLFALLRASAEAGSTAESTALATATAKVRRVLPRRLAERVDALLAAAVISPRRASGGRQAGLDRVEPDIMLSVATAVRDRRPLVIDYRNRSGEPSRRSVQPHDLIGHGGHWYVVGFDAVSHEVRHFRLDRIASAQVLGGVFPEPPPHDPTADLIARFADADYRYLVVLKLRASLVDIRRVLPESIAKLDDDPDGWLRATIHAESLSWLPATLLALDCEVVIVEPDELRTAVADAAARLAAMNRS